MYADSVWNTEMAQNHTIPFQCTPTIYINESSGSQSFLCTGYIAFQLYMATILYRVFKVEIPQRKVMRNIIATQGKKNRQQPNIVQTEKFIKRFSIKYLRLEFFSPWDSEWKNNAHQHANMWLLLCISTEFAYMQTAKYFILFHFREKPDAEETTWSTRFHFEIHMRLYRLIVHCLTNMNAQSLNTFIRKIKKFFSFQLRVIKSLLK